MTSLRQHRLEQLERLQPHAGGAAPRLASFSAIISRTIACGMRLADAGSMRQDEVALQRLESAASMRTLASFPKPVLMP